MAPPMQPHPQVASVIFDARCRFCIAGSRRLAMLARRGAIELVPSDAPDRGRRFPQVSDQQVDEALQLVTSDGRVRSGAAAIAFALSTRPVWRLVTWLYEVPGLRWLTERAYAFVARRRYRILGRAEPCDSDACAMKFGAGTPPPSRRG